MEELIIAAVYKRKAIWDPTDGLRKNSKILNALWAEVAQEVGIDVKTARAKWKNLRAYFAKELRELEIPKSGSGGNTKTVSTWSFFSQLMFLKDVIVSSSCPRDDNLHVSKEATTQDSNDASQSSETNVTNNYETFEQQSESLAILADVIPETSTLSVSQETEYNFLKKRSEVRKRKQTSSQQRCKEDELIEIEKKKIALLEKEINTTEDPDLNFFKSLLPYMHCFNGLQKLRVRAAIQEIVTREYEATQSIGPLPHHQLAGSYLSSPATRDSSENHHVLHPASFNAPSTESLDTSTGTFDVSHYS
ncbi:uncharacterized protein LOC134537204 [Bacillus rossius redtenbacheri]